MRHFSCLTLLTLGALLLSPIASEAQELSTDRKSALDRISADSLRGHLSFLASDLLEGRGSPSRGLDIAAEYIAAQYRRAGLEPVGDDGYFQTANWIVDEPDAESFSLTFRLAGETIRVRKDQMGLSASGKLDIEGTSLVRINLNEADVLTKDWSKQVEGKAVLIDLPAARPTIAATHGPTRRAILSRLAGAKAALVVVADHDPHGAIGFAPGRITDPETKQGISRPTTTTPTVLTVHDPKVVALLDALRGPIEASVSLHLGEPIPRPAKVRNVVGVLRGSDPKLKETFVLVTAHYDHLGFGAAVNGDRIYNGANDDGSGTVSVVEIAGALGSLRERPKRSVVFMTFFGEERGLLGSRYYGRHPIFPIDQTVADVNLEQVGRTDSSEGPQVATASLTGIDFSTVGAVFQAVGEAEGVKVYKHPRNSDAYFGSSDNQALADLGVPAHTLCVAYAYPDYHGAADHWEKVDYVNLAKIDRVVARAVLMIADDPNPPTWNEANPRAARYRKARDAKKSR